MTRTLEGGLRRQAIVMEDDGRKQPTKSSSRPTKATATFWTGLSLQNSLFFFSDVYRLIDARSGDDVGRPT